MLRRRALAVVLCLALPATFASSGSGRTDATTRAAVAQSQFEIRGVTGLAARTHGGLPAELGRARFVLANRGDTTRRVSVVEVEFLRGTRPCESPPDKVVSHPKAISIAVENGNSSATALQVEVQGGAVVEAVVSFTTVTADAPACERFAIRVYFQVDGKKVAVLDEVHIVRKEPLHRGDR